MVGQLIKKHTILIRHLVYSIIEFKCMHIRKPYVLMLDNDTDDRYFTQSAMKELGLDISVEYRSWSEELPLALESNTPSLIVLADNTYQQTDINIIRSFKRNPSLSHVPVVVLSEDILMDDVQQYYVAGANSVIKKPSTVALTQHKVKTFFNYWFGVAEL